MWAIIIMLWVRSPGLIYRQVQVCTLKHHPAVPLPHLHPAPFCFLSFRVQSKHMFWNTMLIGFLIVWVGASLYLEHGLNQEADRTRMGGKWAPFQRRELTESEERSSLGESAWEWEKKVIQFSGGGSQAVCGLSSRDSLLGPSLIAHLNPPTGEIRNVWFWERETHSCMGSEDFGGTLRALEGRGGRSQAELGAGWGCCQAGDRVELGVRNGVCGNGLSEGWRAS